MSINGDRSVLRIESLSISLGEFSVQDVSLEIRPNEYFIILGPSGAGKTVLLETIAGIHTPEAGRIFLDGREITGTEPRSRNIGMVYQDYMLFPHLTVEENIAFGLRQRRVSPAEQHVMVEEICTLLEIRPLAGRYPGTLSGGEQQRVALARALVMEPSVLLFDEPLSNLDAKLRIHMRREIRKIQRQFGITSIYVTHDQAEAMSMSDRIIVMNKGVIEQVGTPKEIYATPASQFVADFIGTANMIPSSVLSCENGEAEIETLGTRFRVKTGLALQPGDAVKLIVRPEAVSLSRDSGIPAEIGSSVFMGSYQDYVLSTHGQTLLIIDSDPANHETFDAGEKVFLGIAPNKLHIVK